MALRTKDRKAEIIQTTLSLLGSTSLDKISTRQIARAVGVSQPALFRHFRSRDAILAAVVKNVREELAAVAQETLRRPEGPLDAINTLSMELLEFIWQNPGIPRLLFHAISGCTGVELRTGLSHLISMQRALMSELVRSAIDEGELPQEVDPYAAGCLFVALIQGTLVQQELKMEHSDQAEEAIAIAELFIAGLQAGKPALREDARYIELSLDPMAYLDVRPLLEEGADPLDQIMEKVRALPAWGIFHLTVPFRPTPLIALLSKKGFTVSVRCVSEHEWELMALGKGCPSPIDLSDRPAPEPLEEVLLQTAHLEPAGVFTAVVPRYPRLLLPQLKARELSCDVFERADGSAILLVRKPS